VRHPYRTDPNTTIDITTTTKNTTIGQTKTPYQLEESKKRRKNSHMQEADRAA